MSETYDITYEGAPVGTAKLEKQGLYYKLSCRCPLPGDGLYRVHVVCGQKREDLGICVPMENLFGMDKSVPIKRLGEGQMSFELVPKDWKPPESVLIPESEPEQEKKYDNEMRENRNPDAEPEDVSDPSTEERFFVPVRENEPFDYLDSLEDAALEMRDDEIGIVLQ